MTSPLCLPSAVVDLVTTSPIGSSGDVGSWLISFLITLGVELALVALAWRRIGRPVPLRSLLIACFLGNLLSHPLATVIWHEVFRNLSGPQALIAYAIIESGVVLLEAIIYLRVVRFSWPRALTVSLIANTPTALFGVWLVFYT